MLINGVIIMNEELCPSFEMGVNCAGFKDSEMCSNCIAKNDAGRMPIHVKDDSLYRDQNKKASERQVGGTHYTDMGIQPFEFTYANYGYIGLKAAVHTKVNKYLGRVKDNEVEQLKKARHCLDILIEKAEQQ